MSDRLQGSVVVRLACFAVVVLFLREVRMVAVPLLMAATIAITVLPLAHRLDVPRWARPVVAMLIPLAVIGGVGALMAVGASDILDRWATYAEHARRSQIELVGWLSSNHLSSVARGVSQAEVVDGVAPFLQGTLTAAIGTLAMSALVLAILLFITLEVELIANKLDLLDASVSDGLHRMTQRFDAVQRYVLVKLATSTVTGVACGLLCLALGVPHALFFGTLALVLNFVPTVGSYLAAIPAIALATLVGGWQTGLMAFFGYGFINTLIGFVLEPWVGGDALGLSPVVAILCLLFWGWTLGPMGAVLSIPLTMVVRLFLLGTERWHDVGVMMGPLQWRSESVPPGGETSSAP